MSFELALRLIGMVVMTLVGARFGQDIATSPRVVETFALVFGLTGSLTGLILTPYFTTRPARFARSLIRELPAEMLFFSMIGLIFGLIVAALLAVPLSLLPQPWNQWIPPTAAAISAYVSITAFAYRAEDLIRLFQMFFRKSDSISSSSPVVFPSIPAGVAGDERQILMDSSAIIDGRILDISKTGFLTGRLIVPNFILREIQHIADESNPQRRSRGRRGLDILEQMQRESAIPVSILDVEVEGEREADHKLVALALQLNATLLTTDKNLRSIANLQKVQVLNVNDLAMAVKTALLPGEILSMHVIAEGREPGQGVGYLPDGTMVVIEDGRRYLDRHIDVVITKAFQTTAGKMYFARLDDNPRK